MLDAAENFSFIFYPPMSTRIDLVVDSLSPHIKNLSTVDNVIHVYLKVVQYWLQYWFTVIIIQYCLPLIRKQSMKQNNKRNRNKNWIEY